MTYPEKLRHAADVIERLCVCPIHQHTVNDYVLPLANFRSAFQGAEGEYVDTGTHRHYTIKVEQVTFTACEPLKDLKDNQPVKVTFPKVTTEEVVLP